MMTRSVCFSVFPLIIALSPSSTAQNRSPDLSISISAKADRVRSGSPLVIEVTEKNVSSHQIYRVAGPETTNVDVLDANGAAQKPRQAGVHKGEEVKPSKPGGMVIEEMQSGSAKFVPMAPGETWTYEIVVTQRFDLSKPGVYTIQARCLEAEAPFKSNIVRVTIMQ
jgi:hypothetical protein